MSCDKKRKTQLYKYWIMSFPSGTRVRKEILCSVVGFDKTHKMGLYRAIRKMTRVEEWAMSMAQRHYAISK